MPPEQLQNKHGYWHRQYPLFSHHMTKNAFSADEEEVDPTKVRVFFVRVDQRKAPPTQVMNIWNLVINEWY